MKAADVICISNRCHWYSDVNVDNKLKRATAATSLLSSLLGLSASIVKSCDGACQHMTIIVFRGHTCMRFKNDSFLNAFSFPRFLAFLCERTTKRLQNDTD